MAISQSGWQHARRRRYGGERQGLRASGLQSRIQRFPQDPFVALLENGTHVLWSAHMDQYATDELTLAEKVIPSLRKGMLCMADRFFPSYKLWQAAAKTGADLLWRTRQNARLDVEKRLLDGSYLSRILRLQCGPADEAQWDCGSRHRLSLKKRPGRRAALSADHNHPRSRAGAGQRVGSPVSRAMGD